MKFNFDITPLYRRNVYSKYKINEFTPIVSIITPFYNSGSYIFDTAICVLNQSYPWFEWIIIDDGSTDENSLAVLADLEKLDSRIKVFHKKNEGPAATRDYGAKKSCKDSKYLLFLDDDDLIETNYIECTLLSLLTNNEASFAYTNSIGFGEMNYLWDVKFDIKREINENLLVATALIKKDVFFEVNGYNTKEKSIYEDWLFWIKLFSNSKIPLRLNYFGFWYRRKKSGELQKALNNKSKTRILMAHYIDKVDYNLKAIEYPKDNYDWDNIFTAENVFEIPSTITNNKENIIMIMPHIVTGGADKFNIDFLKGLDKKYSVTAIFTNISDNEWLSEIKKYVDVYYILPSFLDRKYWHYFIEYLIKKNNVKLVFNTNSIYGYMSLPYLKNKFDDIKILDYIHMEEWYNRNGGYSRDSSSVASVIDQTLVCNKNSEKILIEYFRRDPKELKTVYIGVDENEFNNNFEPDEIKSIKEKYRIPEDKKIITFIARIAHQKRPYLLLEIIKEYLKNNSDSIFLICGDGPLLGDLTKKVNDNNLNESVLFLGNIKNTKEIYAISDCTLNCSIKEGLALTTYESLAMGVPVVSSNVGGQSEIIDNTVGFVIDTNQSEQDIYEYNYDKEEINKFVKSLETVLKKNKYYKSNCRKKILNGFTINQMNQNMNKTIDLLISKQSNKHFLNKDIALELLDQYLLESREEFKYFINLCNSKYDYSNNNEKYNSKSLRTRLLELKSRIVNFTIKIHLYHECRILYKILLSIFKFLLIPVYLIKLLLCIIIRIKNLIYKLFK